MARGSQQNGGGGRVARGKGAASSRKARPPARRASEAAPEPPLIDREKLAAALLDRTSSPEGRKLELARVYIGAGEAAETAGGRDKASLLTLQKHCLIEIGKIDTAEQLPEKLANLEAQNAELKGLLSGAKGSALRADNAPVPPGVGDEQRHDLAPADSDPRGGEPHQP